MTDLISKHKIVPYAQQCAKYLDQNLAMIIEDYILDWNTYISYIILSGCNGNLAGLKWYLSNPRIRRFDSQPMITKKIDHILLECLYYNGHQRLIPKLNFKIDIDFPKYDIPKSFNERIILLQTEANDIVLYTKVLIKVLRFAPALTKQLFTPNKDSIILNTFNLMKDTPFIVKELVGNGLINKSDLWQLENRYCSPYTKCLLNYYIDTGSRWCVNLDSDQVCQHHINKFHTQLCIDSSFEELTAVIYEPPNDRIKSIVDKIGDNIFRVTDGNKRFMKNLVLVVRNSKNYYLWYDNNGVITYPDEDTIKKLKILNIVKWELH